MTTEVAHRPKPTVLAFTAILASALAWIYWPTLLEMGRRWSTDPRYSHGYIVPAFALYLIWIRRHMTVKGPGGPSAWGLLPLAVGLGLRLAGARFYVEWLEGVSLLPALLGLVLLAGGRPALKKTWPAVAFLVFMVPLPFTVEVAMAGPLQKVATKVSTYSLQTMGLPALADGNVIHIDEVDLGVVEACSGLSMLFTFFAVATGAAIVLERPWLDRLLLVASAVPIALLVNIIRITATGVLHVTAGSHLANLVFHDLAGWLMMPMALGFLWAEAALLSRLLIEPAEPEGLPRAVELAARASSPQADPLPGNDAASKSNGRAEAASPRGRRVLKNT